MAEMDYGMRIQTYISEMNHFALVLLVSAVIQTKFLMAEVAFKRQEVMLFTIRHVAMSTNVCEFHVCCFFEFV